MRTIIVILSAFALCGCATITRGTTSTVGFDSKPSGAEVRLTGGLACVTPCSLAVKRNEEFVASFTKAGYIGQQVEVKTQLAGSGAAGFAGNVVAGGVIGMGVDVATGAALEHTPNPVFVALEPERRPPAGTPTARR
jgi:hypothetical protein